MHRIIFTVIFVNFKQLGEILHSDKKQTTAFLIKNKHKSKPEDYVKRIVAQRKNIADYFIKIIYKKELVSLYDVPLYPKKFLNKYVLSTHFYYNYLFDKGFMYYPKRIPVTQLKRYQSYRLKRDESLQLQADMIFLADPVGVDQLIMHFSSEVNMDIKDHFLLSFYRDKRRVKFVEKQFVDFCQRYLK